MFLTYLLLFAAAISLSLAGLTVVAALILAIALCLPRVARIIGA